jgi:hypothetical protein
MLLACSFSTPISAQSDENSVSLGDLARYLRNKKSSTATPAAPVIDNDNFSQVMKQSEEQKKATGILSFSIKSEQNMFQVSSPDATCNLSFNANATSLLTDPLMPRKMPAEEFAKLYGPARINGDNLEIAVHNGSDWTVREITVGLTIVRPATAENVNAEPKLLPASANATDATGTTAPSEKASDTTLILHLKAEGTPQATTVFRQALDAPLAANEEWHWAIVDAKGIPPAPASVVADGSMLPGTDSTSPGTQAPIANADPSVPATMPTAAAQAPTAIPVQP